MVLEVGGIGAGDLKVVTPLIDDVPRAERLHALFPKGSCLAVINKEEPAQQAAFLMILDSLMKKP